MIEGGKKRCAACKLAKPVSEFSKRDEGDGLQGYCAECNRAYCRRRHAELAPERARSRKAQR